MVVWYLRDKKLLLDKQEYDIQTFEANKRLLEENEFLVQRKSNLEDNISSLQLDE